MAAAVSRYRAPGPGLFSLMYSQSLTVTQRLCPAWRGDKRGLCTPLKSGRAGPHLRGCPGCSQSQFRGTSGGSFWGQARGQGACTDPEAQAHAICPHMSPISTHC